MEGFSGRILRYRRQEHDDSVLQIRTEHTTATPDYRLPCVWLKRPVCDPGPFSAIFRLDPLRPHTPYAYTSSCMPAHAVRYENASDCACACVRSAWGL